MRKPRLYRKVAAGHQVTIGKPGVLSLHVAPDHLLLRSSSGFVETYRRFYLTDIEAITICKTVRGIFLNAGLGLGLFFSLMPVLVTRGPHPFAWSFAGVFALLLVVNVLRGPTCQTQLQTRVQTRSLPLYRVPKAVRVIGSLSESIMAAQAALAAATPIASSPQPATPAPETEIAAPPPLPNEPAPEPSWLHLAASALLVLTAALALMSALQPNSAALAYLTYAGVLTNLVAGIATLVIQRGRPTARGLAPLAWISLIVHGVATPMIYMIYSFIYAMRTTAAPAVRTPGFQFPISALRDLPGFTHVLAVYGLFALLLGLTGCIWWFASGIVGRPRPAA